MRGDKEDVEKFKKECSKIILEIRKKKYAYFSIQEIIVEKLRDAYFKKIYQTKRGRPKKIDAQRIITQKKLFTKKGGEIVDV